MNRHKLAIYLVRLGVIVLGLLMAVLMFGPFQGREQDFGLSDKEAHLLAFFGLTTIMVLAFPRIRKWDVAMGCLIVAAMSEVIQMMVGRDASLSDWLADGTGILMAVVPMTFASMRDRLSGKPRPHSRRSSDRPAGSSSNPSRPRSYPSFLYPSRPHPGQGRLQTMSSRDISPPVSPQAEIIPFRPIS